MSTIQAIETAYKGYRFRSRLEARWAMFYDQIGCEWTYEPEPVSIDGEGYLPDFLVTHRDLQIVHEVKGGHERKRIRPPKVYLAGKMDWKHDWRGEGIAARSFTMDDTGQAWLENAKNCYFGDNFIKVVGPFRVDGGHNYIPLDESAHGAESYASGEAEDAIVKTCLTSIHEADVFCAHISTPDAYGTLVEIGYAKGNNPSLPMSLTIEESLVSQMWTSNRGHDESDRHDLWFPSHFADITLRVDGIDEARAFHAGFIKRHTTRELRRIAGIGRERPAIITFGDPVDAAASGASICWNAGWRIQHLCFTHKAAAEASRAHRFDGR